MSTIQSYSYEIVSVSNDAGYMHIIYSAPGKTSIRVSARLPNAGEPLERVIASYAPLAQWELEGKELVIPMLGTKGVMAATPFVTYPEGQDLPPKVSIFTEVPMTDITGEEPVADTPVAEGGAA